VYRNIFQRGKPNNLIQNLNLLESYKYQVDKELDKYLIQDNKIPLYMSKDYQLRLMLAHK